MSFDLYFVLSFFSIVFIWSWSRSNVYGVSHLRCGDGVLGNFKQRIRVREWVRCEQLGSWWIELGDPSNV